MKTTLLPALSAAVTLIACGGTTPAAKDTTAPTVSVTRSASDNSGTVVLTATATDNVSVTKVEFYQSGTLLATDTTAPFTYATDVTLPRTSFTARASDAAGNVGTSAAFDIITPYQGVWGWALADSTSTIIDSGAVIFFDEGTLENRVAGLGIYQNESQARSGFSLMGPLSATTALEVLFSASTDTSAGNYFYGLDTDATLGSDQGHATVEGSAIIFDAAGNAGPAVAMALVQDSAVVPSSLGGQALARRSARQRAAAYLATHHVTIPALKSSPAALKSAAGVLLNR